MKCVGDVARGGRVAECVLKPICLLIKAIQMFKMSSVCVAHFFTFNFLSLKNVKLQNFEKETTKTRAPTNIQEYNGVSICKFIMGELTGK